MGFLEGPAPSLPKEIRPGLPWAGLAVKHSNQEHLSFKAHGLLGGLACGGSTASPRAGHTGHPDGALHMSDALLSRMN